MDTVTTTEPSAATQAEIDRRRLAFDERYGAGAHDRLLTLLAEPARSFADIAAQFGVTRERVRQWRAQWLPEAPGGRQRRQQRVAREEKRRLLLDPLFRAFHRHARAVFGPSRIHLLRARRGYRTREVRIDDRLVALRDLTPGALHDLPSHDRGDAEGGSPSASPFTRVPRYRGRADFIYFRLAGGEFLFVAARTSQLASHPRNTFAAFDAASRVAGAAPTFKEHSL